MQNDQTRADIRLTFNGINGATGGYLQPPLTPQELATIAQGERRNQEHIQELESRHRRAGKTARALKEGIDPKDLAQTGWGVVFAHSMSEQIPAIKEALGELLAMRQIQAGDLYREYIGVDAYRPGESKSKFLARHGAGPGPVDPTRVPYYLLLVGDPQAIPFDFQYQLDVQHAVGRLHFDALDDYASYARSVVGAARGERVLPRKAAFFGVQNPDDPATHLSATEMVNPLADTLARDQEVNGWECEKILGESGSKANLAELLGGHRTPALLFTASHGMGFPNGDPRQLPHQGALLCQDWPGPEAWREPIPPEHYFSAEDLGADAQLFGLLTFHFACYGAGTPRLDDFPHQALREPAAIAPHPFLARLPQHLLAHPAGGALAVVGHVERAWGYSFLWEQSGAQLAVIESTLKRLMEGHPVGSALEYFNQRYAELSTLLTEELRGMQFGKLTDELELAGMWTANNDARSYVILGDPAVRIPVGEPDGGARMETIAVSGEPAADPVIPAVRMMDARPAETAVANIDFGLSDSLRTARARLSGAIQAFVEQLGQTLENALDDATTLDVYTYVSEDLSSATGDMAASSELRAFTRIKADGDTEVGIPEPGDGFDESLWAIHMEVVKQAQANRAEMLKAVAAAASGLMESLKNL